MRTLTKVRILLAIFMVGLVLSGVTAFPLQWELALLDMFTSGLASDDPLRSWIIDVYTGVLHTDLHYPFISYGTDWLGFAHIVIAVFFIGPLRDPVKNIWVIEAGMIACLLIFPLAFIAGGIRGIPFFWQMIDCAFGAFGLIPLLLAHRLINRECMGKGQVAAHQNALS